jgi:hypothetical protein
MFSATPARNLRCHTVRVLRSRCASSKLSLELLEGQLRVKDLPEAWRDRMQADLGLAPANDRDGCLQTCIGMV